MARTAYASLWVLLALAVFAQCALGQGAGSLHVFNDASNDITHWKYLYHNNGTIQVISHSILPKGTADVLQVPEDVRCISASYFQYLSTGDIGQVVLDWCKSGMPVDCLPNCYWIIDDSGFSVASSERAPLQHVYNWEKWTS
ncbi:unnamed protein product [Calypogeia fissa]